MSSQYRLARDLSDTLGGKPFARVSLQRPLCSLPPFHGTFGDEFIRECSIIVNIFIKKTAQKLFSLPKLYRVSQ
jgi:hypothetical protein